MPMKRVQAYKEHTFIKTNMFAHKKNGICF